MAQLHRCGKGTNLMAFAVTSTGVIATKGRGSAKTVTFSVSFKELDRWAKKMRYDAPAVLDRTFAMAAKSLKKKFEQVIRHAGGVNGVPKFHDFEEFTKSLRAVRGESSRPMGGILAEKHVAVFYKKNGYWVVGWPDRLAEWAVKFQDGGDYRAEADFQSDSFRHWMHVKGIHDIPRQYVHNPRLVFPEPFGSFVSANLDEWARHIYYKALARKFQKAAKSA